MRSAPAVALACSPPYYGLVPRYFSIVSGTQAKQALKLCMRREVYLRILSLLFISMRSQHNKVDAAHIGRFFWQNIPHFLWFTPNLVSFCNRIKRRISHLLFSNQPLDIAWPNLQWGLLLRNKRRFLYSFILILMVNYCQYNILPGTLFFCVVRYLFLYFSKWFVILSFLYFSDHILLTILYPHGGFPISVQINIINIWP